MEASINEGMIKYDFVFTQGKKILASLLTEFISPQTTCDLFTEEAIKHHLFHCAFRYNSKNRCHDSTCEQQKKRPHVKGLHEKEFEKIYERTDCILCPCKTCINKWKTRGDINLEKLDLDTFKRLFNCPTFCKKAGFAELSTPAEKILEFRDAVSHTKPLQKYTIDSLLDAANAIKDETKKSNIKQEIEKRLKDFNITSTTEIQIGVKKISGRKAFLETLLGELWVPEKKKQLFAKRNLRFFFESSLTTEKNIGLLKFIEEKEKILNISEKNILLHTLCHFGLVNILKKMLDDPELGLGNLINNTDYRSQNCLMSACEQEEWDTAKMLLEKYGKSFNLHQKNSDEKSALALCVNNKEIVSLFIDKHLDTKDISSSEITTGIAFSLVYLNTLPTLIKYTDNPDWTEHCFHLKRDTYNLYLKWNGDIDLMKLLGMEPNADDRLGKNVNEESVVGMSNLTFKGWTKSYRGFQIHQDFEPTLFCICDVDVEYIQEYVLRNISEDGVQDIIGTIEKKGKYTGVTFKTKKDILALERFGVIKRPIRRQYMLKPEQENYVVFDCGGHVYFPKECFKQPETVYIWEQRRMPFKDSLIKAGTDMIFIESEKTLILNSRATFTFLGKFPADLHPKMIKIPNIKSGEIKIDSITHQRVQTDLLEFSVDELCGKCVVFCDSEKENHKMLENEIKLMYLNYKRCIAYFGVEEIKNGITMAWIVILSNNEKFEEFLKRNSLHLDMYQKKENLIVRDFCTFSFKCIGTFKCDSKQFLHVQFCSETNFVNFEIQITDTHIDGGFEAESSPDVEKFKINFSSKIKIASYKEWQICERRYGDSLCYYHPEELVVLLCRQCKVLVCLDCITCNDHRGHSFSRLESICEESEIIIENFIENNNRIFRPNVSKSITEIKEQENFNKKNEASELKAINLWREKCIEYVNKQTTVMETEIKTHYNNNSLLKLKGILITKNKQLEKYSKEFSGILDHGTFMEKYDASEFILQKEKEVKALPVIPKTDKIELVYVESEARKLIRKALGEIKGLPIMPPKHQQNISTSTSFDNISSTYYALTPVTEDKSWCGVSGYNKLCMINKQGSVEQELQTSAYIIRLCLHPITGVLYGTFNDKTICTIDTTTVATTTVLTCPYEPYRLTVTPEGDIIVGELLPGHVYRYSSNGQLVHQSKEKDEVWDISYSDINDHVAIACGLNGVTIMDGTLTNMIHTHKLECYTVVYDRDGSLVIGDYNNKSIHILDGQTFSTIRTFTPPQMSRPRYIRLYDNSMWIYCSNPYSIVHVMFQ